MTSWIGEVSIHVIRLEAAKSAAGIKAKTSRCGAGQLGSPGLSLWSTVGERYAKCGAEQCRRKDGNIAHKAGWVAVAPTATPRKRNCVIADGTACEHNDPTSNKTHKGKQLDDPYRLHCTRGKSRTPPPRRMRRTSALGTKPNVVRRRLSPLGCAGGATLR